MTGAFGNSRSSPPTTTWSPASTPLWTSAQPVGVALRHVERGVLRIHRLQRDQRGLRRDVRPDAHEAAADDARERRADHGAVESGLQQIVVGVGATRFGLGLLEI